MTHNEMLKYVKLMLNVTGDFQDETISRYIDDVKFYAKSAGISDDIINSKIAVGVIARGVSDLWNYGNDEGKFSNYFRERVVQLKYEDYEPEPSYEHLDFIKDYLFEIDYANIDYEKAYKYFKNQEPSNSVGMCSSVRNGSLYGRNLDWTYDENAEFIVRTPKIGNYHKVLGVAGAVDGLTNSFVKSKQHSEMYDILPFCLFDGINDAGLVANLNIVPHDKGTTSGTIPKTELKEEVCTSMLVRFILDRFSTAKEALEYLDNYVSIYVSKNILAKNYEIHMMLADTTETYIVEFYNNRLIYFNPDRSYMTNFFLYDIYKNSDGSVYTPESIGHRASENNISDNGSGLERYNLINLRYSETETLQGMRDLLNDLKYTNSYRTTTSPFWYTEFTGINNLTVNSNTEDFETTVNSAVELFKRRKRDKTTWQTVHSSIYDISSKKISIVVQEDSEVLEFEL